MSRLIKKLIFWLVDIGTILLTFFMVRSEWLVWKDRATLSWYIGMIVIVYIVSVIELIVMRIFNFIHKFDDYDGFGDFLKHLLQGPLALVTMTIYHFIHICGCIYGMIRRKVNPQWTNVSTHSNGNHQFKQNTLTCDENVTRTTTNGRKTGGKNEYMYTLREKLDYIDGGGASTNTHDGFISRVTYDVSVRSSFQIHIMVNVNVEVLPEYDDDGYLHIRIDNFVSQLNREVAQTANSVLKSIQREYSDMDGNWKITVKPNIT